MTPPPPAPTFGIGDLLVDTWTGTRRALLPALPLLAILVLPQLWHTRESLLATEAGTYPWRSMLIVGAFGLTVGAWFYATLLRLALDGLGGSPNLSASLATSARRFLPFLAAYLLLAIAVALGTLLCLVPGLFIGLSLAVTLPIVLDEEVGPIEALRRSWARMAGRRALAFGAGLVVLLVLLAVSFPIAGIVGIVALATTAGAGTAIEGFAAGFSVSYAVTSTLAMLPWMAFAAALHRRVAPGRLEALPAEMPTASTAAWTAPPSP